MKPILTEQDYQGAARLLGCAVAAIKAVAEVESAGTGFLCNDEPKILFERHTFHRLTAGRFDAQYPDISNPVAGGYGNPGEQHKRLKRAAALDHQAALMATSWGKFQILGLNFKLAGFAGLQLFVNAMYTSEPAHLLAFCNFIRNTGLLAALRAQNWPAFGKGYNGPQYKKNRYDLKMKAAYERYSK
ncbi:N-acetylmuramidase family protein [Niabella sp.]|uniref:N-acetylmuramidase family protein n=1 Tax=Niabella sp. TaxID=1962976 RepID=UPI00260B1960|nr:N-acetylmuramidase family protein [Niabella sp.]